MTREFYVAIDVPMHRFEIRCENRAAMLRLAAHAGEQWKDALADREYRSVVQLQGDHGLISIQPHAIQHIEPLVREPMAYDWPEPIPLRYIRPDPRGVLTYDRLKPKRRSRLHRLLRRLV